MIFEKNVIIKKIDKIDDMKQGNVRLKKNIEHI